MNKDLVIQALNDDMCNSALGIICTALEQQGYQVVMDGQPVTGDGFWEGNYFELEGKQSLNLSLLLDGKPVEQYMLEFVDFHEVVISSIP